MTIWHDNKKITLISLIIPLLMQLIFSQLYGTANTILLSGYSGNAVSASSVANQILDICTVLLTMVQTGTTILSSIELGAENRKNAARHAGTGSFTLLAASLVITAVSFIFAEDLLALMNLQGETLKLACDYFRVRIIFLPVLGLMNFFNHLLICNGFSKYTMLVGVLSNAANLLLSWAALYSGLNLTSPIEQVALAAGLAQIFGLCLAILFFVIQKCPYSLFFNWGGAVRIIKLGVPGSMVSLMFRIAQTVTTGFVALMGEDVINTKVFINNIVAYVPLLCYAIGSANMVFMGRYKGAGQFEKAKVLFRQNRAIAFGCNLVLSLIVLIFHAPLMRLFTSNQEIIAASSIIFFIDLFVQLPRAINNISEGALSANGDVKITFFTSTLSCWIGSVGLSYMLCIVCGMGLSGLWIAFAVDESIKSVIYVFRWRSGKWQNIDI